MALRANPDRLIRVQVLVISRDAGRVNLEDKVVIVRVVVEQSLQRADEVRLQFLPQ